MINGSIRYITCYVVYYIMRKLHEIYDCYTPFIPDTYQTGNAEDDRLHSKWYNCHVNNSLLLSIICTWIPAKWAFLFTTSPIHYDDVIMGAMASQITSLPIVYSTVYSDADQRKHQSPASLAFVWGLHRGPVNSPHKWPVTRKMFLFDDVIIFHWTATLSTFQDQKGIV